jgi:Carboxypeptidase regulatory-like domain
VAEVDLEESQEAPSRAQVARFRKTIRQHASLHRFQALVGLLAGMLSISGAFYSYTRPLAPSTPTTGEIVALVQVEHSSRPLTGATIEVVTVKDAAIVTTLLTENGRARQTLKEGIYRLRVTYPRFDPQVRQVLVLSGQTSRLRIGLVPHPVPPRPEEPKNPVSTGFGAIRRIFQ